MQNAEGLHVPLIHLHLGANKIFTHLDDFYAQQSIYRLGVSGMHFCDAGWALPDGHDEFLSVLCKLNPATALSMAQKYQFTQYIH
jgi:hypothetical protein